MEKPTEERHGHGTTPEQDQHLQAQHEQDLSGASSITHEHTVSTHPFAPNTTQLSGSDPSPAKAIPSQDIDQEQVQDRPLSRTPSLTATTIPTVNGATVATPCPSVEEHPLTARPSLSAVSRSSSSRSGVRPLSVTIDLPMDPPAYEEQEGGPSPSSPQRRYSLLQWATPSQSLPGSGSTQRVSITAVASPSSRPDDLHPVSPSSSPALAHSDPRPYNPTPASALRRPFLEEDELPEYITLAENGPPFCIPAQQSITYTVMPSQGPEEFQPQDNAEEERERSVQSLAITQSGVARNSGHQGRAELDQTVAHPLEPTGESSSTVPSPPLLSEIRPTEGQPSHRPWTLEYWVDDAILYLCYLMDPKHSSTTAMVPIARDPSTTQSYDALTAHISRPPNVSPSSPRPTQASNIHAMASIAAAAAATRGRSLSNATAAQHGGWNEPSLQAPRSRNIGQQRQEGASGNQFDMGSFMDHPPSHHSSSRPEATLLTIEEGAGAQEAHGENNAVVANGMERVPTGHIRGRPPVLTRVQHGYRVPYPVPMLSSRYPQRMMISGGMMSMTAQATVVRADESRGRAIASARSTSTGSVPTRTATTATVAAEGAAPASTTPTTAPDPVIPHTSTTATTSSDIPEIPSSTEQSSSSTVSAVSDDILSFESSPPSFPQVSAVGSAVATVEPRPSSPSSPSSRTTLPPSWMTVSSRPLHPPFALPPLTIDTTTTTTAAEVAVTAAALSTTTPEQQEIESYNNALSSEFFKTPTFAFVSAEDPQTWIWWSTHHGTNLQRCRQEGAHEEVMMWWRTRLDYNTKEGKARRKVRKEELKKRQKRMKELKKARELQQRQQRQQQQQQQGGNKELGIGTRSGTIKTKEKKKTLWERWTDITDAKYRTPHNFTMEITMRVRGLYYAWKEDEYEFQPAHGLAVGIGSSPRVENSVGVAAEGDQGEVDGDAGPLSPPYAPPSPPLSAEDVSQQPQDIEMASILTSLSRSESIAPSALPSTTSPPPAAPSPIPSPSPVEAPRKRIRARMFTLIRDDSLVMGQRVKGRPVAQIWIGEEEEFTQSPDEQDLDSPLSTTIRTSTSSSSVFTVSTTSPHSSFPSGLCRRKCIIRILQGINSDVETFALSTGPRLPELFDMYSDLSVPGPTRATFICSLIVFATVFMVSFLSVAMTKGGPQRD